MAKTDKELFDMIQPEFERLSTAMTGICVAHLTKQMSSAEAMEATAELLESMIPYAEEIDAARPDPGLAPDQPCAGH